MTKLKNSILKYINLFKKSFKIYNSTLLDMLEKNIQDCESVLDLGCGSNSKLQFIKKKFQYTVGVDISKKNIEVSMKKGIHNKYFLLNILDIDTIFKQKCFDCVLLIDVIEHLKKLDGLKLIIKIEKIAKKKIIIFTPNGYVYQPKYNYNEYQIHKSGWKLKIFKKMNFKVYGLNGLKNLRGEFSNIKYKPFTLWNRFSSISNIFIKKVPQFAYHLYCIKEL